MKILISLISYDLGGSERRYFNLAKALSKNPELDVTFLVTTPVYERLCRMSLSDVGELKVIKLFESKWSYKLASLKSVQTRWKAFNKICNFLLFRFRDRFLDAFCKSFDVREYDVWHRTGAPWKPCLPKEIPTNSLICAAGNEIALPGHAIHVPFYADAIQKGTLVEVLTPGIKNEIVNFFGNSREFRNLRVAPCSFIDHDAIPEVTTKEKIITFLGRFHRQKNPVLFVQMAAKVSLSHPDYEFHMMGYGPLESLVLREIEKYGIQDKVKVWREDNPIPILLRSQIFVSIQTNDNYPSQALMEAMSAGCAIVASDRGDTHLMVPPSAGKTAPLDPNELADAVIEMLGDSDSLRKMGESSRSYIRKNFTCERYVDYLMGIYEEIYKSN